jgi:predicted RNA binding protein YcfA (HicA-like mRNA interferase family)
MPKLLKLKGKELIRILAGHGFDIIRIKGSHHSSGMMMVVAL